MDKNLTKFIAANIQATTKESEKFMHKLLNRELIQKLANDIWESSANTRVSAWTGLVEEEFLDTGADIGVKVWLHIRSTPFFAAMIESTVKFFFNQHGNTPIYEILTDAGIDEKMALTEAKKFAPPALKLALKTGYMEARIRNRLSGFYEGYESS